MHLAAISQIMEVFTHNATQKPSHELSFESGRETRLSVTDHVQVEINRVLVGEVEDGKCGALVVDGVDSYGGESLPESEIFWRICSHRCFELGVTGLR